MSQVCSSPVDQWADSSRRAVREALTALERGDDTGARDIANAHQAQRAGRQTRSVLVLPLRRLSDG
jgi:hypothetical protein